MRGYILAILGLLLLTAATDDVFTRIGTTQGEGETFILNSITNGHPNYPNGCHLLNTPTRVEVARVIVQFAKTYSQSLAFQQHYNQWWIEQEPTKPKSVEERIGDRKKQTANQERKYQEELLRLRQEIAKATSPDVKKNLQVMLKAYEDAAVQKKDSKSIQMMADLNVAMEDDDNTNAQKEIAEYQSQYAEWQRMKDSRYLLRQRLQQYIDLSATVDYEAEVTTDPSGRRQYVKPEYRAKNGDWKTIYRAGREVNETLRPFAAQWLKEIQ